MFRPVTQGDGTKKPATMALSTDRSISLPRSSSMLIGSDLGNLSTQQRAIVLAKPYWRMGWFASLLNWHALQLEWVNLSQIAATRGPDVPESKILVYYVTTDREFHLQINELPDHPKLYQATVGPFRYGIGLIGWHRFELCDDDADLIAEAQRLKPFLDRQQFRDPVKRAAWKKAHPEFVLKRRTGHARRGPG